MAPDALTGLLARYPGAETFKIGDGPELSARLLTLICAGQKVASCGALRDYENGDPMPVVGRRDIALHWDGTPACVIETQEVVICRYDEITEAMALAEGENDDLAGWASDHAAFFDRNGGFAADMLLVWERFAVVKVVAPPKA